MDENSAWKAFFETGRIQDYINYSRVKTGGDEQGISPFGTAAGVGKPDEDQNRGTYH